MFFFLQTVDSKIFYRKLIQIFGICVFSGCSGECGEGLQEVTESRLEVRSRVNQVEAPRHLPYVPLVTLHRDTLPPFKLATYSDLGPKLGSHLRVQREQYLHNLENRTDEWMIALV